MAVLDAAEVEAARNEIRAARKILMRLYTVSGNDSGMDWQLAVEEAEDDRRVVGVMNERGDMVMGDCMSDPNNEVTLTDAQLIALMDPRFVRMVIDLFNAALEEIDRYGAFEYLVIHARRMAQKIVKQWEGGVSAQ
ncbi:hypothetical protein SEA_FRANKENWEENIE_50 [Streptomyces phage Frankenweenie]|nr:hypothetical protein SEA_FRANKENWEENIE_50 [Streptomyces phage Frankenweenie]